MRPSADHTRFPHYMLSTNRPSVNLAGAMTQKKQIIEYTRDGVNAININGKDFEGLACECHAVTRRFSGALGIR